MKPDPSSMKVLLRKRQAELQKIIKQMKHDQLHTSPVYRNLEQELESLKAQADEGAESAGYGPPSAADHRSG